MSKASKALVATKGKPAAKAAKPKERVPMKDIRSKLRSGAVESSALPWEDEKPSPELKEGMVMLNEKEKVLYETMKGMGFKATQEKNASASSTPVEEKKPHPLLSAENTFTNHPVYQQAEEARKQRLALSTTSVTPLATKQAVFASASGSLDAVHYQSSTLTKPTTKPKKVSTSTFGNMSTPL